MYKIFEPNAIDPEDSEEDYPSEPEDSPDTKFDRPGKNLLYPPIDPEHMNDFPIVKRDILPLPKKCAVPKPRLVYDVKLPKHHRDKTELALPKIPDVKRIAVKEHKGGIEYMEEPIDLATFDFKLP